MHAGFYFLPFLFSPLILLHFRLPYDLNFSILIILQCKVEINYQENVYIFRLDVHKTARIALQCFHTVCGMPHL